MLPQYALARLPKRLAKRLAKPLANSPAKRLPGEAGREGPRAGRLSLAVWAGLAFWAVWALGVGQAQAQEPKIALVMKELSNPFFWPMQRGAEAYARPMGLTLDVYGLEHETDVEAQIGMVEEIITRGYQAMLIAPADSSRLAPACLKALEAGMVVVNIDNKLDRAALGAKASQIPFFGPDNRKAARRVAEHTAHRLGQGKTVLIVGGVPGADNSEQRVLGFKDGIARTGLRLAGVEHAGWRRDEARAIVSRRLAAGPRPDAIMCANDQMALGALDALGELGLAGMIPVTGYDNIPAMREAMRAGLSLATVEQYPDIMGFEGARLAHNLARQVVDEIVEPVPTDLIIPELFGKVIGMSIPHSNTAFFRDLARGAERAAEAFGVTLRVLIADNNEAAQLGHVARFIQDRVDGIVLCPVTAYGIVPGIEAANAASIPVVTADRAAAEGRIVSHISSDNRQGGLLAGSFVVSHVQAGARILELEGLPGSSVALERGQGFQAALAKAGTRLEPVREVGFFDQSMAKVAVGRRLALGERFDAIFAHNDEMLLGALAAYAEAKVERPPVMVGFDATPEAQVTLAAGRIDATVAQLPMAIGHHSVVAIMTVLQGGPVEQGAKVGLRLIKR